MISFVQNVLSTAVGVLLFYVVVSIFEAQKEKNNKRAK